VRCRVDAAVAYHGADTEKYLGEVENLSAPMLMHLGEEDEFISKAAQDQIKTALGSKANATVYSYPGSVTPSRDIMERTTMPPQQRSPNGRTSEFLHQQLL
jgi:carboxymethylenebutenolidase